MTRTILDYALAYARRGFKVFPVYGPSAEHCSCSKGAACTSPAKHPVDKLAPHGSVSATTDEGTLRSWFGAAEALNYGIALVVGDDHIVVDIDPRSGGDHKWRAILAANGLPEEWQPETPMQRSGGGGFHYLFTKPRDARFGAKLDKGVDTKTGNGYIVVEPSRHVSGGAYAWDAEQDLTEGAAITQAPDWLLAMGAKQRDVAAVVASNTLDREQVAEIRSALGYLPDEFANDYHRWIEIGQSLHSTGSAAAFGLWADWSQSADAKKQASLNELKKKWASFGGKSGITIATLYYYAKQNGYKDRRSELKRLTDEADRPGEVETFEPDAPTLPQIPCSSLFALSKHVAGAYGLPDAAALAVTLSFAGTLASRRYTEDTHFHAVLCGPPAVAAAAHRAMSDLFAAVALTGMLRTSRANVPSSIYGTLFSSPSALYAPSDLTHQARAFRRNPHGAGDHTLLIVAESLNQRRIILESGAEAGIPAKEHRGKLELVAPALSFFAAVDEAQVDSLFVKSSAVCQLVDHSIWVEVDTAPDVLDIPVETPTWITQAAREMRPEALGFGAVIDQNAMLNPRLVPMAGPGYEALSGAFAGLTRPEKRNALRLASTLAAWESPASPVITASHLSWVVQWILEGRSAIGERRAIATSEEGKRDVRDHIVEVVIREKSKGILRSQLHNRCKPYRNLSAERRDDVISQLVADKELAVVRSQRGADLLVATKYARSKSASVIPFDANRSADARRMGVSRD